MLESVLDTVGHTPLVLLNRLSEGLQAKVAVKVEFANPGGSVKDRVAMAMIADAEQRGLLRPGGTAGVIAAAGTTSTTPQAVQDADDKYIIGTILKLGGEYVRAQHKVQPPDNTRLALAASPTRSHLAVERFIHT